MLADVTFGNPSRDKLTTEAVIEPVATTTLRALEAWAPAHAEQVAELRARSKRS